MENEYCLLRGCQSIIISKEKIPPFMRVVGCALDEFQCPLCESEGIYHPMVYSGLAQPPGA